MKITDLIYNAKCPSFSFEITPPLHGHRGNNLEPSLCALASRKPLFIDVTSRAAKMTYKNVGDGYRQHILQPTPGTLPICSKIQEKYDIPSVPHALCQGFTPKESQTFLIDAYFGANIDNVLVVRGDDLNYDKKYRDQPHNHAIDLVKQIVDLNSGKYLYGIEDIPTDFCIGIAGYPEKHIEAANYELDLKYLKDKVDAGAHYIVTQMFFDNSKFFQFVENCRNIGITCPIIPGLKLISRRNHLTKLPQRFHLDIPHALSQKIIHAETGTVAKIGVDWATSQVVELLANPKYFWQEKPIVHFYITGKVDGVIQVLKNIDSN